MPPKTPEQNNTGDAPETNEPPKVPAKAAGEANKSKQLEAIDEAIAASEKAEKVEEPKAGNGECVVYVAIPDKVYGMDGAKIQVPGTPLVVAESIGLQLERNKLGYMERDLALSGYKLWRKEKEDEQKAAQAAYQLRQKRLAEAQMKAMGLDPNANIPEFAGEANVV